MNHFHCARVAPRKLYQIPLNSIFVALGSLVYEIPTLRFCYGWDRLSFFFAPQIDSRWGRGVREIVIEQ
jgi:hypothetical protein